MSHIPADNSLDRDIVASLDDALDALRWVRRHIHDRRATEALRLLSLNLTAVAQALDWQMEGQSTHAAAALARVWWQPHKRSADALDQTPRDH